MCTIDAVIERAEVSQSSEHEVEITNTSLLITISFSVSQIIVIILARTSENITNHCVPL